MFIAPTRFAVATPTLAKRALTSAHRCTLDPPRCLCGPVSAACNCASPSLGLSFDRLTQSERRMLTSSSVMSLLGHLHVQEYIHLSGATNADIVISGWISSCHTQSGLHIVLGDRYLHTLPFEWAPYDHFAMFTARASACSITEATRDPAATCLPIHLRLFDGPDHLVDDVIVGTFTWTDRYPPYASPTPSYPHWALPLDLGMFTSQDHNILPSPTLTSYHTLTAFPADLTGPSIKEVYHSSPAMTASSTLSSIGQSSPTSSRASAPLSSTTASPSSRSSPLPSPLPAPAARNTFVRFLTPLKSAIEGWLPAERKTGRRLVQFIVKIGRNHSRTVFARTLHSSSRVPASSMANVVSCIAGPSDDFLITSVDVLRLASLLYGGEVLRAERHRLRRHLERFAPRTIGRHGDIGELYTRIAMYDAPSPFTINKTTKVFRWSQLEDVIEAVVAKRVDYNSKNLRSRS
jgi:hypothetical protein